MLPPEVEGSAEAIIVVPPSTAIAETHSPFISGGAEIPAFVSSVPAVGTAAALPPSVEAQAGVLVVAATALAAAQARPPSLSTTVTLTMALTLATARAWPAFVGNGMRDIDASASLAPRRSVAVLGERTAFATLPTRRSTATLEEQ